MANEQKKQDNDDIRKLKEKLNDLTLSIEENTQVENTIPESNLIQKYRNDNTLVPDVIVEEEFSNLVEKVVGLQFSGKKQDDICTLLTIQPKEYKAIITSDEYLEVKRRFAEDQKLYILSKSLEKLDMAFKKLGDLIKVSDADSVSLSAINLLFEQTKGLLNQQISNSNDFGKMVKDATKNAGNNDDLQLNLAQVIIRQRRSRGLDD